MMTEETANRRDGDKAQKQSHQNGPYDAHPDLSQILSVISHEIKNPLASLTLNGQMIARAIERGQAPRGESARLLRGALEQLNQLASELSDVGRFDGAQPALTLQPTDLVALAREAAAEAETTYQRPIGADLPDEPLLAQADVGAIWQVMRYLLDNAARFTPAGGAITLAVSRSGEQARIEARDEGPGVAPADRARVFDAFYRGATPAQPHTRLGAGLGLGLYIARRIVQWHGGEIGADAAPESETGTGSVIWFTLPLAEPSAV